MTEIIFEPESANLVIARHASNRPHLMLNYIGRYAEGSDVRVPGLPGDVRTIVSVRAVNDALVPDQGSIGKLSAPGYGLFSFEIEQEGADVYRA